MTLNYMISSHKKQLSKKGKTSIKSRLGSFSSCSWDDGAFHLELLAVFKAVWIATKPFASLSHIRTHAY